MDQQFQTSFIPRKPSAPAPAQTSVPTSIPRTNVAPQTPPPRSSGGGSIFGLLTGIFFIGTILSAIGVYAYNLTLTKQINSMSDQINIAKKSYQEDLISKFESTDKRLRSANEVFNNHIIVSPIFYALQDLTLKAISFDNFSYIFNKDGGIEVKLSGRAASYEAIALQSDTFSTNRFIKDPVFSNLNLDEDGKISFDLSFLVDKTFVNYIDDVTRSTSTKIENSADSNAVLPSENSNLENGAGSNDTNINPNQTQN